MINYCAFSFTCLLIIINNLIGDIYASTGVWNNLIVMQSYAYIFYVALLKTVGKWKELHCGSELISGAVWFKIFPLLLITNVTMFSFWCQWNNLFSIFISVENQLFLFSENISSWFSISIFFLHCLLYKLLKTGRKWKHLGLFVKCNRVN